ncbi:YhbD family protein [Paenibacillus filicis]|uniref:YhbD family protein n=1 Tax=Paenibacillus filicis TaxID=669464 RepID=A0ABU9DRF6_9BACL
MSDEELISKKELLELKGISYGQLYRWKRKQLIPEEWFIRKSTFTGQETFFPKRSILARIDKIVNMKDGLSLDELADVFSPVMDDLPLQRSVLLERNIVSKVSLDVFTPLFGEEAALSFQRVLVVYMLDKLLHSGEINLDEGRMMLQTLQEREADLDRKPWVLAIIRKMGISSFVMAEGEVVWFEPGTKIVARLHTAACVEELKLKLS